MPVVLALLLAAVVLAGCGDDAEPAEPAPAPPPEQTLRIATDPVLGPLLEEAGEQYEEATDTRVEVEQMDGETARGRLCDDEAHAAGAARPPACSVEGLVVGYQALAIVGSRELDSRCLTVQELGNRTLAGPPPDTTAFDFFGGEVSHRLAEHEAVEDERVLAAQLERSETELAFWTLGDIVFAVPDRAKLIAVDAGDGCVKPTERTVRSGEYPLARPLLLYAKADQIRSNHELLRFLRFTLENHSRFGRVAPSVVAISGDSALKQLESLPFTRAPAG